ncbi:hypothetical protein CAPTEDRAFT_196971 [Capitella teleta]|uniref:C-type lectin domain-containing protein n=1 Tax=Capitella teleta TaxID=283909 RepID=R7THC4_CAPTE|nr:hypothetical protein CAPTEDRAFT_196971 [Capitella teleta]|eukprot:ELT90981.1 hypothetical protein CAPTEDRAFT_196971 [Capitella teleta]
MKNYITLGLLAICSVACILWLSPSQTWKRRQRSSTSVSCNLPAKSNIVWEHDCNQDLSCDLESKIVARCPDGTELNHVCQEGWDEFEGNCYLFVLHDPLSWTDASESCFSLGGLLASILIPAELDFIQEKMQSSECHTGLYAIHACDGSTQFAWIDGNLVTDTCPIQSILHLFGDVTHTHNSSRPYVCKRSPDYFGCYTAELTPILDDYPSMTVTLCRELCQGQMKSLAAVGHDRCACLDDFIQLTEHSANQSSANSLQSCADNTSYMVLRVDDGCTSSFVEVNDRCYWIPFKNTSNPTPFYSAEKTCAALFPGGRLASIDRDLTLSFVEQMRKSDIAGPFWALQDDDPSQDCLVLNFDGRWLTGSCEDARDVMCMTEPNSTSCPNQWFGYRSSCYSFISVKSSYNDVTDVCREQGGLPSTVNSVAEFDWLLSIANELPCLGMEELVLGAVSYDYTRQYWSLDGSLYNYIPNEAAVFNLGRRYLRLSLNGDVTDVKEFGKNFVCEQNQGKFPFAESCGDLYRHGIRHEAKYYLKPPGYLQEKKSICFTQGWCEEQLFVKNLVEFSADGFQQPSMQQARVYARKSWKVVSDHIIAQFESPVVLTGILTRGSGNVLSGWVSSYHLEYKVNGEWVTYTGSYGRMDDDFATKWSAKEQIESSGDQTMASYNVLQQPVVASEIRISGLKRNARLQWDLFGCPLIKYQSDRGSQDAIGCYLSTNDTHDQQITGVNCTCIQYYGAYGMDLSDSCLHQRNYAALVFRAWSSSSDLHVRFPYLIPTFAHIVPLQCSSDGQVFLDTGQTNKTIICGLDGQWTPNRVSVCGQNEAMVAFYSIPADLFAEVGPTKTTFLVFPVESVFSTFTFRASAGKLSIPVALSVFTIFSTPCRSHALYSSSFTTVAPRLWNQLPFKLRSAQSLSVFKSFYQVICLTR